MSLYLISLSPLNAQVIIKEKVEINPQNNVLPTDPQSQNYSLCNGFSDYTVVWFGEGNDYGINYHGGPGVNMNVSVIQGAEYVKLYLSSVPNSWGCDNFSLMPDNFNYSNMLCITAEFNETEPIDTAIIIIKFTNLADPSYIDYNKFIVVKPMYHLEVEMLTQLIPGDFTDIIVQSFNQCGDMFMYCNGAYRLGDCLPGNVSYNVQMISGFEFGYLKNTSTGEMGFQLSNLIPEWETDNSNYNRGRFDSLQFIAENYPITEPKEITIRFSANDVAIIPIDINLVIQAIEQDSIEVSFEKSIISPGDTTRVFLKKKGLSGLQDFPLDKLFNVEIIDGIGYGLILDSLSNDTLTTFSNIPQGFKIIAKDSTGIDSTKIRIKVTTEDDGIPFARMIKNNTNTKITEKAQTISEGNDDETILPDFGVIIPGPPLIEGFGDLVVKEYECDFESCNWNYNDIEIVMNRHNTYSFEVSPTDTIKVCDLNEDDTDYNTVGQSKPIPYNRKRKELNWGNSWEIEPCLNYEGKVKFSIVTPDRLSIADLYFDFMEAVCEDIIKDPPNNGIIIENFSDLHGRSGKELMSDFCEHQPYPISPGSTERSGNYLWQVIRVHEGIHGDRFYKILNDNKQSLINELNQLVLDCQVYKNIWGLEAVELHIQTALAKYFNLCKGIYYAQNNEQEIQCHFVIRELIKKYLDQVNNIYRTKIPDIPCYKCKE